DLDGDEDVNAQQRSQLCAGLIAVEGLDRVTDVDLVLQQSGRGRRESSGSVGERDDCQARPRHVVLPQFAHRVVELDLGRVVRGGEGTAVSAGRGGHAGKVNGQGCRREGENGSARQRGHVVHSGGPSDVGVWWLVSRRRAVLPDHGAGPPPGSQQRFGYCPWVSWPRTSPPRCKEAWTFT